MHIESGNSLQPTIFETSHNSSKIFNFNPIFGALETEFSSYVYRKPFKIDYETHVAGCTRYTLHVACMYRFAYVHTNSLNEMLL